MPTVLWTEESGYGEGSPFVSVQGTDDAVPRGIESVFRYNGFTLNDTGVIDKYRILSIDGLDDPDLRDSRENNPSTHGETPFNSFYGGRTLAIRGKVEAYTLSKLRSMQLDLRTAFADLTEKPLYFLTGDSSKDHFINCRKFSKNQWGEEQKDFSFFRDFLITLRASDPRFLRHKKTFYTIDNLSAGTTQTKKIVNKGNFEAFPVIRMNGPLNKFTITNDRTGIQFRLKDSVTIASDDFYELDLSNFTPTIVNKAGQNKFGDFDTSFNTELQIKRNENNFAVEVDVGGTANASSNISVIFRDSFI